MPAQVEAVLAQPDRGGRPAEARARGASSGCRTSEWGERVVAVAWPPVGPTPRRSHGSARARAAHDAARRRRVPRALVRVDALPMLATGKTDRWRSLAARRGEPRSRRRTDRSAREPVSASRPPPRSGSRAPARGRCRPPSPRSSPAPARPPRSTAFVWWKALLALRRRAGAAGRRQLRQRLQRRRPRHRRRPGRPAAAGRLGRGRAGGR